MLVRISEGKKSLVNLSLNVEGLKINFIAVGCECWIQLAHGSVHWQNEHNNLSCGVKGEEFILN